MINTYLHTGGLLEIILDSPKGNMLSVEDIDLLSNTLFDAECNPELKGILLTGANRSFCTGLDINFDLLDQSAIDDVFEKFDNLLYQFFIFPKPVVGAINGHSIGGGLLLQSCTDYNIISFSERIKLGLPEVKLGLTIDNLMLNLLSYSSLARKRLESLLLDGTFITPEKALLLGFVDELVPADTLLENAILKLQSLVGASAQSYRLTKLLARQSTSRNMQDNLANKSYTVFGTLKKKI